MQGNCDKAKRNDKLDIKINNKTCALTHPIYSTTSNTYLKFWFKSKKCVKLAFFDFFVYIKTFRNFVN